MDMIKERQAFYFAYGKRGRALYGVFCSMHARCRNKNHIGWRLYGGRGIKVCDAWKSFERFVKDMGVPEPGQSLERVDNDGNYCKKNVVWADKKTQANNNRRNRVVEIFGEKKTLAQWSEDKRCQASYANLYYRIIQKGWDPELALLSRPYDIKHQHKDTP